MDRTEKILLHLNKQGLGLEIGPSHAPIAPKKDGFNVQVIDHTDKSGLIEKYKTHNVNLDNIEEVDLVWTGGTYSELTGKKNHFDWIIASHVIEHVPDLVGFINSCDEVLKDEGVISLAIPDARYCFDHFRETSSISSAIDAHLQKHEKHPPGAIVDFQLNVVKRDNEITWSPDTTLKNTYEFISSLEEAKKNLDKSITTDEYIDCHRWCFTPHSFRLMMQDLYNLGLIKTKELGFMPTAGCEFYITLSRNGNGANLSRLEMLETIKKELAEEYVPITFKTYSKSVFQKFIRHLRKAKHKIGKVFKKA